ncbi:aconitate hydratase [Emiliania huxleyi CCMP1516]|uniref:(2R,3S)-2-methylisocitrate dehydratase n=2 Tax=Emiliania huxleyi TaxID=2903 RepID=A0A0D3IH69_EMIH1|nr:aconitate hydratase [Emiliania huxleyi CCMP1516]EOD10604.1 aconitate hydratase [Emiliania huxleyi CCMP1516]|eukprot:XP_005763033.1 aconitate hydratase [Emiliania huxleyi CCMP1516]
MRTVSRSLRARTLRSLTRGPLGLSRRAASSFMTSYEAHKAERAAQGIVPLPLDATQTASLIEEMKTSQDPKLLALLEHRVPPGVDEAAYVKADYLAALAKGTETNDLISKKKAVELLGTMQGGYNIAPLIDALEDAEVAETACTALKHTILVFDAFHDVKAKMDAGNEYAKKVIESWAAAEWFTSKPEVKEKLTFTVFKVAGETNTDDLSPAPDAWSRPDIPLHALAMLKFDRADGFFTGQQDGCKDVLEIEGEIIDGLKCEQVFELSDASAERSAAGCAVKVGEESISEYLTSNITMLKWMVSEGYGDPRTLQRRAASMQNWLDAPSPKLMAADASATYHTTIEIPLEEITEGPHGDGTNTPIDEVFIGSCMTNIGHFRAAGKMLDEEGFFAIYGKVGARTEMPGCSLCMGNQARVADKATVVSTSTRNFPNRLGKGANVYLASAELAAVAAIKGRLPTPAEYLEEWKKVDSKSADVYKYLNFDTLDSYQSSADKIEISEEIQAAAAKL